MTYGEMMAAVFEEMQKRNDYIKDRINKYSKGVQIGIISIEEYKDMILHANRILEAMIILTKDCMNSLEIADAEVKEQDVESILRPLQTLNKIKGLS